MFDHLSAASYRNHSAGTTCSIHEENLQNYRKVVVDESSKTALNSEGFRGNITLNPDDFDKYLQRPCRGEFSECSKISKGDIDALFSTDTPIVPSNKRSAVSSTNENSIKRFVFRQSNVGSVDLAPSRKNNDNDSLFVSAPAPPSLQRQTVQHNVPSFRTVMPKEPDTTRDKNSFISAREELQRQSLIKNGQNPNQPSTAPLFAYGKSTKTLGVGLRRSVHSKFVPPYGNNTSSSTSSLINAQPNENVTSDSDIDPRLKSVEPKMIELIQNEIMHQTSTVGKVSLKIRKFLKFFPKDFFLYLNHRLG